MSHPTSVPTEATACVVIVENQRIPLPNTTTSDDEIRKLITPFWPSAMTWPLLLPAERVGRPTEIAGQAARGSRRARGTSTCTSQPPRASASTAKARAVRRKCVFICTGRAGATASSLPLEPCRTAA